MIQRFAVEFDHRVVGIAVRVPGGFMFFSSDDDFERLDGQLFPRARAISRHLERIWGRKRRRGQEPLQMRAAGPLLSRASAGPVPSGLSGAAS